MIIQIIGLPGSGKTTLANALAPRVNAVVWNADKVRENLNKDLGFSTEDRLEQARRMGWLAKEMSEQGLTVISDFICPTGRTRQAYGNPDVLIWVNRIDAGRFEDTNLLWEDPEHYDVMIPPGLTVEEEVTLVFEKTSLVDWREPHALMLGRFQPWHEGHEALWQEANTRTGNTAVAVRSTFGLEKDPLTFDEVKSYIPHNTILRMPNITHIIYGRDVGYKIEQVHLSPELEKVSATDKRKQLGLIKELICLNCPPGGCQSDK